MKKLVLNALIATGLAAVAATASADTGNVRFTGQITTSPCSIGGGQQGANMTVSMGSISTNNFTGIGTRGPDAEFSINLLNCDITTMNTANFTFSPNFGSVINGRLLGLENGMGAQGVAVGLKDASDNLITVSGAPVPFTLVAGNNAVTFKAFYEATASTVTAGVANASAIFEVTYS